jgi:hypothetical protein
MRAMTKWCLHVDFMFCEAIYWYCLLKQKTDILYTYKQICFKILIDYKSYVIL